MRGSVAEPRNWCVRVWCARVWCQFLRNHNNDNDAVIDQQQAAFIGQQSTIDGLIDVNEFYKDDPSLSENALMIMVISICCFIAIVIILIIIGFCYTRRPSAYEIHPPNSLQLTSRESPQVHESAGETSMQVPIWFGNKWYKGKYCYLLLSWMRVEFSRIHSSFLVCYAK